MTEAETVSDKMKVSFEDVLKRKAELDAQQEPRLYPLSQIAEDIIFRDSAEHRSRQKDRGFFSQHELAVVLLLAILLVGLCLYALQSQSADGSTFAYVACTVFVFSVVLMIYRWRLEVIRRIDDLAFRKLTDEARCRMACDLHDDLGKQLACLTSLEAPSKASSAEGFRQMHSVIYVLREALDRLAEQPGRLKPELLLEIQRGTISDACRNISVLFLKIAACEVHVNVSLCKRYCGTPSKVVAFPWAYSEADHFRLENTFEYDVNENNTALYEATKRNHDGLTYFFSPDLEELDRQGRYRDQTPNWQKWYRSCIVVPIGSPSRPSDFDQLFGFLKIDTLAKHRLKAPYHLDIAAAFAGALCMYLAASRSMKGDQHFDKLHTQQRLKSSS